MLENEMLENVIAKINQSAFRLGSPWWGNCRHHFTRAAKSTDSKF
ncbi:hypothetical protein Rcae01_00556 [Novipirellula caenicola]|uniref:Uncharacterized protein n=1 Tax=Novipirellula caenicola TaxID=1536901 RepID=A0ABP9VLG6_9BACT